MLLYLIFYTVRLEFFYLNTGILKLNSSYVGRIDSIKLFKIYILLPSLLPLLLVDAFLLTVVSACIRACETLFHQITSPNNPTRMYHHTATFKVDNVYVVRKLVEPWQKYPINLDLFVFPSVCNAISLDYQGGFSDTLSMKLDM